MSTNRIAMAALAALGGLGFHAARAADYASVVSTAPLVAAVPVPVNQCEQVPAALQPAPSGAGALVGGLTGAALGNAAAYGAAGAGRAAATGIGMVLGSLIGNQVEADNTPPVASTVTQCRTVTSYQNRSIGYHVVYDYQGLRHEVDLAQAPGTLIAVDPAGNALVAAGPPQVAAAPAQPVYVTPDPGAYAPAYPPAYAPAYVEPDPVPYAVPAAPVIRIGWGGGWRGDARGRWHDDDHERWQGGGHDGWRR
ncbi:MAG: hypothetical protein KGL43_09895 [Burkholderiales bacterium]|nr:hypothetical protein [Burkholderiales bacterium]